MKKIEPKDQSLCIFSIKDWKIFNSAQFYAKRKNFPLDFIFLFKMNVSQKNKILVINCEN
jgi:hypothetical protein